MLEDFQKHIHLNRLIDPSKTYVLAISGGIDSVCLLDLCHNSGIKLVLAHCNFNLRGTESMEDERFVSELSAQYGFKLHIKSFETKEYAQEKKLSIQMAARELRYSWFQELMLENEYEGILVAHNKDDIIETFFINLSRGSGIRGLTGIKAKSSGIIRPLLFAERQDIEHYIEIKGIDYREDSSNSDEKYLRNAIRSKIIPELKDIQPSFLSNIHHSINLLNFASTIFKSKLDNIIKTALVKEKGTSRISIKGLIENQVNPELLFELITEYGFNYTQCQNILAVLTENSGKRFFSTTHELLIDREALFIKPKKHAVIDAIEIKDKEQMNQIASILDFHEVNWTTSSKIPKEKSIALFDAKKLTFPLLLRKWKHGDTFIPLGMQNKKKLSDFFIDQKFSSFEKDECWLLCSQGKIAWVVGHRIDDRFKISPDTKEAYLFEVKE